MPFLAKSGNEEETVYYLLNWAENISAGVLYVFKPFLSQASSLFAVCFYICTGQVRFDYSGYYYVNETENLS